MDDTKHPAPFPRIHAASAGCQRPVTAHAADLKISKLRTEIERDINDIKRRLTDNHIILPIAPAKKEEIFQDISCLDALDAAIAHDIRAGIMLSSQSTGQTPHVLGAVARQIYELRTHDSVTATTVIKRMDRLIDRLNDYIDMRARAEQIHAARPPLSICGFTR